MIRRLYVDNFRSLVDFTWEPGKETLVLGYNGSGKTSIFDALEIIRNWNLGWEHVLDTVGLGDRSRFAQRDPLRFEVELSNGEERLEYRLALEFSKETGNLTHVRESLNSTWGGLFEREDEDLKFAIGRPENSPLVGTSIPLRQSASSLLSANREATFVQRFSETLWSIVNVRPIPPKMERWAKRPERRPSRSFENFVAWYWSNSSNGAYQRAMLGLLDDVWSEFDYLRIEQIGREANLLSAVFKHEGASGELALDFIELSDGERMLLALYSLVAYQKANPATTIIIDEPDNFVSLLEIQPWLLTMLDTCPDDGQLILISHNTEIIQTFGYEQVAYFTRKDHTSPTSVRRIEPESSTFSLDRWLRRGWLDE